MPPSPNPKNVTNVGKYVRELYGEFISLETNYEKLVFLKSKINDLWALYLFVESSESVNVIVYSLISWYMESTESK